MLCGDWIASVKFSLPERLLSIKLPATPGPAILTTESLRTSLLFPSTSCLRDTMCGSKEVLAMSKTSVKMLARKLTTYRYSIRSMPPTALRGIAPISMARPRSAPISRGRWRTRSTHTPTKRLSSKAGMVLAAPRTPICAGPACSITTAVIGSARLVIAEPKSEIVTPIHSVRKSRCRHKLAVCSGIQVLLVDYTCSTGVMAALSA